MSIAEEWTESVDRVSAIGIKSTPNFDEGSKVCSDTA